MKARFRSWSTPQRPGVRADRADGPGPIARRGSRAGRVPAHPPRAAVFSRRGAPVDLDLPYRRERVPAGSGEAARGAGARLGDNARDSRRAGGSRRRRPIGSSAISSCAIASKRRSRGCRRSTGCVVAAHYLDGVRYEDIADALQLPLGTVKTQLYRAKQQLRRLLETDLK